MNYTINTFAILIEIIFITSCSLDHNEYITGRAFVSKEDRFEVTNSSIKQAKKDGVFLTACTITPSTVAVGTNFFLNVQEAFIEQRHSVGAVTGQVKLLDSLSTAPKLVIIPRLEARLGSLWVGDASIQDRNPPYQYAGGQGATSSP